MVNFLSAGALILASMTLLWLLSLVLKDASIVDSFWGTGFVLVAWLGALRAPSVSPTGWLLTGLVTVWGLRLSIYIFLRNRGKGEDFRYAAWRAEHGPRWWWRSYLQVFLLQGLLMWIIAAPLIAAAGAESAFAWPIWPGIIFWVIGFYFEAAGDWQLARFKQDPANKGRLMTTGVWRFTRHPNYFGDAAQWWGFYLIAVALGAWWTIFAPALMTFLLVRVSGVSMLEKSMSRRPGYEAYARQTSAFIPWFPKQ